MLKTVLKLLAWFLGILILLLGLALGILYARQDQIKNLVFQSINANLNTEIEVGDAGVSIRKFPNAAIRLESVRASGSHKLGDTLFYVQNLYVEFGIWDILGDEIPIKSLSLEKGSIHLLESGQFNNWSIFKESNDQESAALKLESVQLKDIEYRYQSEDLSVKGLFEKLQAKGQFSGSDWNLELIIQSQGQGFKIAGEEWLASPIIADGQLQLWGNETMQIQGEGIRLATLEGLQVFFKEDIKNTLSLKHPKLRLAELKNLYAVIGMEWPQDLNLEGETMVQIDLIMAPQTDLRAEVFVEGSGLELRYKEFSYPNLSTRLEYYQQGAFDRLEIRELRQGNLSLEGTIRQIAKPHLKLKLSVSESPDFWNHYLPEGLSMMQGTAQIDLDLNGQFKSWEAIDAKSLGRSQIQGKLLIEDAEIKDESQGVFEDLNLKARISNQKLLIDSLYLTHGSSDLSLKGRLANIWNFIGDSTSTLQGELDLIAQEFFLADFMSDSEDAGEESLGMAWKERLNLSSRIQLYKFAFRNFKAEALKGNVQINHQGILAENISLVADKGRYEGRFEIHTPALGNYLFEAALKADNVEMASVFKSFDNFAQETITGDNLDGRLSIQARLEAPISPELQLDPSKLEALAEMTLTDGHIKDYEPMQALSRFAEVEELKDVSFKTLSNTISISEGALQIPEMAIASNVINLDLSGTHSFENEIDYVVKMRLGDVLFAKRDKSSGNKEFEEHLEISKRDDDHRIPIHITGTVDEPEIGISRESLGESLKESLVKQGKELKNLFKKKDEKESQSTGLEFEWDEG